METTQAVKEEVKSRFVTVKSTRGESKAVEFNGSDWGDLSRAIEKAGFSLSNMKCVESINRHTLEHPKAVVPAGDFTLFLMPYKSKSGGDVRDRVKAIFNEDRETAKAHFGNYTQKKESELEQLLKTFKGRSSTTTSTVERKSAIKEKAAKATASAKAEIKKSPVTLESIDDKLNILLSYFASVTSEKITFEKEEDKITTSNNGIGEVVGAVQESAEAREKREAEEAEQKRIQEEKEKEIEEKRKKEKELDLEMRELAGGFGDVRL